MAGSGRFVASVSRLFFFSLLKLLEDGETSLLDVDLGRGFTDVALAIVLVVGLQWRLFAATILFLSSFHRSFIKRRRTFPFPFPWHYSMSDQKKKFPLVQKKSNRSSVVVFPVYSLSFLSTFATTKMFANVKSALFFPTKSWFQPAHRKRCFFSVLKVSSSKLVVCQRLRRRWTSTPPPPPPPAASTTTTTTTDESTAFVDRTDGGVCGKRGRGRFVYLLPSLSASIMPSLALRWLDEPQSRVQIMCVIPAPKKSRSGVPFR